MPEISSLPGRRTPRGHGARTRLALVLPALAATTAWSVMASPAQAAQQPAQQVASAVGVAIGEPAGVGVGSRARITRDGSVRVRLWARCPATYQAYELNVSVSQDGAFGSYSQLRPPDVVLCDGTVSSRAVLVAPEAGAFVAGPAQVSVYLGLHDTATGRDLEATATATVRLRVCRSTTPS